MLKNKVYCDQCNKRIENRELAWFSSTERDLDFCSKNCYSTWTNEDNWKDIHEGFGDNDWGEWWKKCWEGMGFSY